MDRELKFAREQNPAELNSGHEALAVLEEELDEFKLEVRKKPQFRDAELMLEELLQVAAMARRAAEDLHLV